MDALCRQKGVEHALDQKGIVAIWTVAGEGEV